MKLSHISWNMAGLALPLLIALVSIPKLIANIGNERFGLLALAWAMMTYAGVLDLGIGRALTQMVSKLRGQKNPDQIPVVLATASRITMTAGLVGSLGIVLFALFGCSGLIKTEHIPQSEIRNAVLLLAIALPTQAMSATYRGMNEAYMNFKGISILRVLLGTINFAGPLIISYFTQDLAWIIASLVVSRVVSLLLFRHLAFSCMKRNEPNYNPNQLVYSSQVAKTLFSFGGWVTVSSILSPMMVQLDRFMIAALLSAAAVTIYVVPFELVAQSLILVTAINSVIFPSLSRLMQEQPDNWQKYFQTWLFRVGALMLVMSSTMAFLMPYILKFWLKDEFHPESVLVGQILCAGVFLNSLSALFYSQLHALGKASVTAKFHMIEFPIYFAFLYFALLKFDIMGAAIAWSARMALDLSLLMMACKKSSSKPSTDRTLQL